MGWPLQEKFDPGAPISSIPRSWFETVAKILNYLMCANGNMVKTPNPSKDAPWIIVPGTAGGSSGGGDTLPDITDHAGQVLTVNADASAAEWAAPAAELPAVTVGDVGRIAQVNTAGAWSSGPVLPSSTALASTGRGVLMYWNGSAFVTTVAPAAGDMLVYNGTLWTLVPKPSTPSGQVLTFSSGTSPAWVTPTVPPDPPAELPSTGKAAYKVLSIGPNGSTVLWDYVKAV